MANTYDTATSSVQFLELLKHNGHELYRRGKQVGIVANRKYRLSTLGYPMEKLQLLDRDVEKDKRLEQINKLRNGRLKDLGRER